MLWGTFPQKHPLLSHCFVLLISISSKLLVLVSQLLWLLKKNPNSPKPIAEFFFKLELYIPIALISHWWEILLANCPEFHRFCIPCGTYVSLACAFEQAGGVCAPQLKRKSGIQCACPALDPFQFRKGQGRFAAVFKPIVPHVGV